MSSKYKLVVWLALVTLVCAIPAHGQLLRKNDYGVGVTLAIYQFDDARSKEFPAVAPLKLTLRRRKRRSITLRGCSASRS